MTETDKKLCSFELKEVRRVQSNALNSSAQTRERSFQMQIVPNDTTFFVFLSLSSLRTSSCFIHLQSF